MTLAIGPLAVDPPVVLAPMAGVTDLTFRTLCRDAAGGSGIFVNEMLMVRALVEHDRRTMEMARFAADEHPRSLQLYGTAPHITAAAVRVAVDELGVDHVDLNFGCPATKVTRNGGGAAIPVRRRLLADIIDATVRAAGDVPVTVKFRKGTDDDHLTFLDTGRIAAEAGAVAIALHARTAEQHYAGHADWDAIGELKAAVTTIPVLGNGDVWEAGDALAMMAATGCDGVVIGRGCLGRPWLFRDLACAFAGRPVPAPPGLVEQAAFVRRHARVLVEHHGVDDLRRFRRHAAWYLKGYPLGGAARRQITAVSTLAELDATLDMLIETHGDVALPEAARRTPRGHTSGPHPVHLPDGWYDSADDPTPPVGADIEVSGG